MIENDHNKQVVHRLFEDALNQKHPELLSDLISDEYAGPGGEHGAAAFRAVASQLWTAFPDIQYKLEDVLADGDRVAVRWTWTGTFTGQFRELPPSNKAMTNSGMSIFELHGGKVTHQWLQTDRLGFLQAIGLVPAQLGNPPPPHR